jgi:hypothetical protein
MTILATVWTQQLVTLRFATVPIQLKRALQQMSQLSGPRLARLMLQDIVPSYLLMAGLLSTTDKLARWLTQTKRLTGIC